MKKIVLFLSAFAFNTWATAGPDRPSTIVPYTLHIGFNKAEQWVDIRLQNQSPTLLKIRKDAAPFSLLIRGLKLSVFEESVELKRVPVYYPIGSNAEWLDIPPKGLLNGHLTLAHFLKDHCKTLSAHPMLVFWSYSARAEEDGEYLLLPSDGVFRVSKSDVVCD